MPAAAIHPVPRLPVGPAFMLRLLGGCSFKAQIHLLKMLFFLQGQGTHDSRVKVWAVLGRWEQWRGGAEGVVGKPSHHLAHDGRGEDCLGF